VSDVLVLAVVLLLVASGYAAGRVHAEIGYRSGYRLGYRQGHADATRHRSPPGRERSDTRQIAVVGGPGVHEVRHARG
jgi:hypothetical protein